MSDEQRAHDFALVMLKHELDHPHRVNDGEVIVDAMVVYRKYYAMFLSSSARHPDHPSEP